MHIFVLVLFLVSQPGTPLIATDPSTDEPLRYLSMEACTKDLDEEIPLSRNCGLAKTSLG